jgi:serine kinase of HPr protein (carbohydrate metabolism regulator)
MTDPAPVHATAVADWTHGSGWRAVVISGASGAGKSDLALRLIGRGWRLVADDYVHLFVSGDAVYATAPETIAGRIEARGLGIVGVASLGVVRVVLAVELTATPPDRLPDAETRPVSGRTLPLLRLNGFEPSAVEKVAAAIARL